LHSIVLVPPPLERVPVILKESIASCFSGFLAKVIAIYAIYLGGDDTHSVLVVLAVKLHMKLLISLINFTLVSRSVASVMKAVTVRFL
jgi:hypothetical protein